VSELVFGQRIDVSKLLSASARALFAGAAELAAARGAADLDSIDLLGAATATEPARSLLAGAGADPDLLSLRITQVAVRDAPGEAPVTLSPAAKRAVLDAQRIGRVLGASYIGPEHLVLAIAANSGSSAAKLLSEQGVTANEIQQAVVAGAGLARVGGTARPVDTPALTQYGRDMTEDARAGKLDPVVGRDEEIEQAIEILSRRTKNNPCLIGEPGVGKTAIVEGIAQRIVNDDVPESLRDKRVVAIDLTGMATGSKYRGESEGGRGGGCGITQVIDEIKAHSGELLIFIDEAHMVVGAGSSEGGMDAANILKPALARGELHVIAATTIDEYRRHIEKDAALERRFQPLLVPEPSVGATIEILNGLRDSYEAHHQVRITDDALDAAARMSDRYIADRFLPDKAIDLIDQASARVRLRAQTPGEDVRVLRQRLDALHRDKDQAVAGEDFEKARELAAEIDELRPQLIDTGRESVPAVSATDIAEVVSRRTGIPVSQLTAEERDMLLGLEEQLHRRVIGQHEAVTAVAEAVRRSRTGLSDPERPAGSFLFLGPPGVGKTELAKTLASALFGGEDHVVRIDMSECTGYDGAGQLTEAVRRRPHSVVLLDKIEKAAPDVLNILLRLLDDGRLTDSHGRTVDFCDTVIIMTSNGQPALRAELLNRIDDVVVFASLDRTELREIVDLLLADTRERLGGQDVRLQVTDGARDALVEAAAGARELRRTVQREVSGRLSRMLLSGELRAGDTATVGSGSSGTGGPEIIVGVQHSAAGAVPAQAEPRDERRASTATQIQPPASTSQKFTTR
jgi:ATP-dependent Clp protease ATP-binding subunit ClpC